MQLPPWLAGSADTAGQFTRGVQIGAQIGSEQARVQLQQQQMLQTQQEHAVEMARRALEFSLQQKMQQDRLAFEREKFAGQLELRKSLEQSSIEKARIAAEPRQAMVDLKRDEMARKFQAEQGLRTDIDSGMDIPKALLRNPEAMRGVTGLPSALRAQQAKESPKVNFVEDPVTKERYAISTYAGSQRQLLPPSGRQSDSTFGPRIRSLEFEIKNMEASAQKSEMFAKAISEIPEKKRTPEQKKMIEDFQKIQENLKAKYDELAKMRQTRNNQSSAADMIDRLNANDNAIQSAREQEAEDIDLGDDYLEQPQAGEPQKRKFIWDPKKNMAVPVQ